MERTVEYDIQYIDGVNKTVRFTGDEVYSLRVTPIYINNDQLGVISNIPISFLVANKKYYASALKPLYQKHLGKFNGSITFIEDISGNMPPLSAKATVMVEIGYLKS